MNLVLINSDVIIMEPYMNKTNSKNGGGYIRIQYIILKYYTLYYNTMRAALLYCFVLYYSILHIIVL